MSHAHKGGQAPDQASDGHQTGAAMQTRTNQLKDTREQSVNGRATSCTEDTRLATAPRRTGLSSLTVSGDVSGLTLRQSRAMRSEDAVRRRRVL
jgi:hypothetical protein